MKNLYLTTAMILSLGGAAIAQTATTDAPAADAAAPAAENVASDAKEAMHTDMIRASALEGVDLYTIDASGETVWVDGETFTQISADWEKIGEVEDLILDEQANVIGAIAEVGGFLGLGETEVVLLPEETSLVVADGRMAFVSALSKEALEQREKVAKDASKDN